MALTDTSLVMDVSPWPRGQGFSGAGLWWEYVMGKEERRRLDNLIGIALLDEEIGRRLVQEKDDSLLKAFGISEEVRARVRGVQATSLAELAQAIVSEA